MELTLKEKIITAIEWIYNLEGQNVQIRDWISQNGQNYDRHFTTLGLTTFDVGHVGVRTSGAIVFIGNDDHVIEFSLGKIYSVFQEKNIIVFELKLAEMIIRRIEISINEN